MNNNTNHIISSENDVPPVTFIKWPLDMDDDEFRAGYPFTPVASEAVNEQKTWCDVSSTPNDSPFQSVDLQNNDFNKTTKEEDESNRFSHDEQAELMKFDVKSIAIHDDNNDNNVNKNEKKDFEEHERHQYDQHNVTQADGYNNKQANQAHSVK